MNIPGHRERLSLLVVLSVNRGNALTNLTLKEIKSAFPEGKQIVASLLKNVDSQINAIEKQYKDIYLNKDYDEFTKEFIVIAINTFHLKDLTEKQKKLRRYQAIYSDREYDNSNLEIAKAYPILDLFTPEKIKRTSGRSFCCCPMHGEKTASFCIYHKTNTFYCFGCHKGGDTITLVSEIHQIGFKDALKYIGGLV